MTGEPVKIRPCQSHPKACDGAVLHLQRGERKAGEVGVCTRYFCPLLSTSGRQANNKSGGNVVLIILGSWQYFHIELGRYPQETTFYCCFSQYLISWLFGDLERGNGNQKAEPKGTLFGHWGFVLLTFPNKLKTWGRPRSCHPQCIASSTLGVPCKYKMTSLPLFMR